MQEVAENRKARRHWPKFWFGYESGEEESLADMPEVTWTASRIESSTGGQRHGGWAWWRIQRMRLKPGELVEGKRRWSLLKLLRRCRDSLSQRWAYRSGPFMEKSERGLTSGLRRTCVATKHQQPKRPTPVPGQSGKHGPDGKDGCQSSLTETRTWSKERTDSWGMWGISVG